MRKLTPWAATACLIIFLSACADGKPFRLSKDVLRDKIKGGWAGQVVGCTFGGPTEFRYQGTFIQDYQPLAWDADSVSRAMQRNPGLYDDVYMDLTFVEVLRDQGLDAPAASFAQAFAEAPYPLWHANQAARYNILYGLEPPASGSWINNPHADDIDFQIEADFAGLMSPGMIGPAVEVCDRVGHIMNSGDGWYGGVYVAAMYATAFVSSDPETIATKALEAIPKASRFHAVMSDVIRWHRENPRDWKTTWFKVQEKWSEDIGCPDGVFSAFNIDAKINAAWVLMGLLYGGGDFTSTLETSTRCGDDSDCNPATAAGILGTALGYRAIPGRWKAGLSGVEGLTFPFTHLTLGDVYDLSYAQALEMIRRNGGQVTESEVLIPRRRVQPAPLEVNFPDLRPVEKRVLNQKLEKEASVDFDGCGIVVGADAAGYEGGPYVFLVEARLDGESRGAFEVPSEDRVRRDPLVWLYDLKPGPHRLILTVRNPVEGRAIVLREAVIYERAER